MTSVLLPLLLLFALVLAWWSNLRAREVAVVAGRRACHDRGLQFLDGTVAFQRYALERDGSGRRRLQRVYGFEFSAPDLERGQGWVRMVGYRVIAVALERADGGSEIEDAGR